MNTTPPDIVEYLFWVIVVLFEIGIILAVVLYTAHIVLDSITLLRKPRSSKNIPF